MPSQLLEIVLAALSVVPTIEAESLEGAQFAEGSGNHVASLRGTDFGGMSLGIFQVLLACAP